MSQGADASIIIQARDRATGQFRKVAEASQGLGGSWRMLTAVLRQLNVGMLALTVALPVVGAALASIITVGAAVSFLKFEQSSRRARIQLQLLGFTAEDSRHQLQTLVTLMDRATATTMFQNAQAMTDVALAGEELTKQIAPMSAIFSDLIGADPGTVFSALFDIFAKSDPSKFLQLVTGTEDIMVPIGILTALNEGDFKPFIDWFDSITATEPLTNMEKLADNLARIAEVTAPAAESISETTAAVVNVFVASLAERAENLKDNLQAIFLTAMFGAWVGGAGGAADAVGLDPKITEKMDKLGKGLGRKAAGGILGGLVAVVLLDLGTTISTVFNDPETGITIGLAATVLGTLTGKAWIAGVVTLLGLELAPGIKDALAGMATDDKVGIAALAVGTAMGLATKKGLLGSLAIGSTLMMAADSLFKGETLSDKGMTLAYLGLGAAIGFAITKTWTGAFFGAAISDSIREAVTDSAFEEHMFMFGLITMGYFTRGWKGAILGGLLGAAIDLGRSEELRDNWVKLGNWIGRWIANGVVSVLNWEIDLINKVLGAIGIPKIPKIAPVEMPEYTPYLAWQDPPGMYSGPGPRTQAGETQADALERKIAYYLTHMDPGATRLQALELMRQGIMVGSPEYSPLLKSGGVFVPRPQPQPVILNLTLDRKVISTTVIDDINKLAHNEAGIVDGTTGR